MAEKDISSLALGYLSDNQTRLLGIIKNKPESDFRIDGQSFEIIKRGVTSSILSIELNYHDTSSEGKQKFLLKYFPNLNNQNSSRTSRLPKSSVDICNFLSGNGDFPVFYTENKYGDGIFVVLEQIGETTLDKIVRGMDSIEKRNTIRNVFPYMSRFQINATKKLCKLLEKGEMSEQKFKSIFHKRRSSRRISEYLMCIQGKDNRKQLDKNLVKEVIRLSVPVQETYNIKKESFRVLHGDPILKNIVKLARKKNAVGFIDADPLLGDPVVELGALLATPGLNFNPSDWDYLFDDFNLADMSARTQAEDKEDISKIRKKIVPYLEKFNIAFLRDDKYRGLLDLYNSLFFRSARIRAKVTRLKSHNPYIYELMASEDPLIEKTPEDMKRNMTLSLHEIVNNPNKLWLSGESPEENEMLNKYVDKYRKFYKLLLNEGIINPPEKYLRTDVKKEAEKISKEKLAG